MYATQYRTAWRFLHALSRQQFTTPFGINHPFFKFEYKYSSLFLNPTRNKSSKKQTFHLLSKHPKFISKILQYLSNQIQSPIMPSKQSSPKPSSITSSTTTSPTSPLLQNPKDPTPQRNNHKQTAQEKKAIKSPSPLCITTQTQ